MPVVPTASRLGLLQQAELLVPHEKAASGELLISSMLLRPF
jgi:hypothetical protein